MNAITNIFPHFYRDDYSDEINWSYLDTIPAIARLKDCPQNPKWHSEGTAYDHTRLCLEKFETEVLEYEDKVKLSQDVLMILRVAILLHDIGKGVTTSLGKDGNWHSYGHEFQGEKIARVLLWNEDFYIRETICSLIRYHMEPLRLFDLKNWIPRMLEIGARVPWKYLYYVKMADLLGSVQINGGTMEEDLKKMELIKEMAISFGIWHKTSSQYKNVIKYSCHRNTFPWKMKNEKKVAYLLIGLPGAGKNTWIEKNLSMVDNLGNLSRDDIRVELGFCSPGEKFLGTEEEEKMVTEAYYEKLDHLIINCKCIVLNNINLKKKFREADTNKLREAGFEIFYIYIEAPTLENNSSRRDGQIRGGIKPLALLFEWPEPSEYDELIIEKQTW